MDKPITRCNICYEPLSEIEAMRYNKDPKENLCKACKITLKEAMDGLHMGHIDYTPLTSDDNIFPKSDEIYYSYLDSEDYSDISYLDDYRDTSDDD